jgi:putative Mn2+ efflux pump MntP
MENVMSAVLFALACNLDTLILAVGYGLRGRPVKGGEAVVFSGATTVITLVFLVLGARAGALLPQTLPQMLGGWLLVGVGLWCLLDWLRGLSRQAGEPPVPEEGGGAAWISLAAVLGVNNAGAGAAAGISGVPPLLGGIANFFCTLFFLALGYWLGQQTGRRALGGWAVPVSGVLLILLGFWGMR